ncbi:MAG: DUF3298 domain-containing protein [Trueperaceae bacterium]
MKSPIPRQAVLSLTLLLLVSAALAQPRQPSDGALYLRTSERGRALLASLHLYPPDGAELRLLEAPARPNGEASEESSVELTLTAPYLEHETQIEVSAETWTFIAGNLRDGTLDPHGEAVLHLYDLEPLEFEAIGTVILGGLRFADGSFAVQRWAPFFYSDPWAGALFDVSVDEFARAGLEQRRELPESPVGTFTESQTVFVTAFDWDLLSYYTLIDTYTGGAHPNSWREATTLMTDGTGSWAEVGDVCAAVLRIGWECEESSLRLDVVDELRLQEAVWVEQGEVTHQTEWLLDTFVLTPGGVRFLFDPYDVGPYAQGPFEVDIPYGELGE